MTPYPGRAVLCEGGFVRQESSSLRGSCIQDTSTFSGSLGQSGQLQEEYRSLVLCLPLLGLVVENRLDISALLVSDRGFTLVLGVSLGPCASCLWTVFSVDLIGVWPCG